MLTELDKKLIHHLLKMASDEFGRHGCNDFDLAELVPDVNERRALVKDMYVFNGNPWEFEPDADHEYVMDFWLMEYMADKVLKG